MSVHGIEINEITLLDVLFGNFDPREDGMVLNHNFVSEILYLQV